MPPQAAAGPTPPPGGPAGGGPIVAALARRQQGPQVSAPGPGDTANSLAMITQAIAMIQQALPGLQSGSPVHTAALRAAQQLSRHVAQGQPTAGLQQTQLMDLLRNLGRNFQMARSMGQPPSRGGPGQPAGPAPPMPSTPLPGS
jgi:hypothetical protein